ncbi:replicative DNA helicase [Streptomyces lydicus]|uniref:replicative DNA helicase n=1 Tax=Streptomyces lydicus TaxID=47763 RepID=UPI003798A2BE
MSAEPTKSHDAEDQDAIGEIMETVLDQVEVSGSRKGQLYGLSTGFELLDSLTGGLEPGTLTVIASRPGMGRTTLLADFCRESAIKNEVPTLFITLEETQENLVHRILAAECRVARHHMRSGCLTEEDWTRLARRMPVVAAAPLWVKSPARATMALLALQAAEFVQEKGIRLIAVDGIQDIRPDKRSDLREREVGDVVRDLKTMARELNVPVVATSHLNRAAQQRADKRPAMDDLRESGAITFASDNLILLHRDDAYEKGSPRAGEADLFVVKHRQGPAATVSVAFQGHYCRFVDMAQP